MPLISDPWSLKILKSIWDRGGSLLQNLCILNMLLFILIIGFYLPRHFYPTAFKGCAGILFSSMTSEFVAGSGGEKFVQALSQKL